MPRSQAFGSLLALILALIPACRKPVPYDLILRGGTLYDGSGGPPRTADVGIRGDRIAALDDLSGSTAAAEIDVRGLAVAPGFINMMSGNAETLLADGRAQSDVHQGITLEVMGEGHSMGPLNERMKENLVKSQSDIRYAVDWTTLGQALAGLVRRGVSPNVASFIGSATPRIYVIGYDDRRPTPDELKKMEDLVRQAMAEGALGLASALIYPPCSFAQTDEVIALARATAEYDGLYISHIRSEGDGLLPAMEEFVRIVRDSGARGEVYHLKAAGRENWAKMDAAIALLEKARAEGLKITADAYPYAAGMSALTASLPPWVQDGGTPAAVARMKDPATRLRIIKEMRDPNKKWESLYSQSGSAEGVLLASFARDSLSPLVGKTLAEAARLRGRSPEETALDILIEDECRTQAIYFNQSEDNLRKTLPLPWLGFCTDESALAAEGAFLKYGAHPRAYGTFPRVLGRYVRDEKLMTLAAAVRKMSALPAETLKIADRGRIQTGFFADLVVFDPGKVQDRATYEKPHQYATGILHVLVNGVPVLRNGEHTGAKPGRAVLGPGFRKPASAAPAR